MLDRMTVRQRMILIIIAITILFGLMTLFAVATATQSRDMGIFQTGEVMLLDQKAKIKAASHALALAISHSLAEVEDEQARIEIVRQMVADIRYEDDQSGYFFVYQGTVNVALPPEQQAQGKDLADARDINNVYLVRELRDKAARGGGFAQYVWPKPGAGKVEKLSYAEMIPGTNMWIGTGVYLDNIATFQALMNKKISALVRNNILSMLLVSGLIFAGIGSLCLLIVVGITKSLQTMVSSFQEVAEGNLSKRIAITSNSEIAELAHWFNVMITKLQEMIATIADGTAAVDGQARSLSSIATQLAIQARDMAGRTENVAMATDQLSSKIGTIAAALSQSMANTTNLTDGATKLVATARNISENAAYSQRVSQQSVSGSELLSAQLVELGTAISGTDQLAATTVALSLDRFISFRQMSPSPATWSREQDCDLINHDYSQFNNLVAALGQQVDLVQQIATGIRGRFGSLSNLIEDRSEIAAGIAITVTEHVKVAKQILATTNQSINDLNTVSATSGEFTFAARTISGDIGAIGSCADRIEDSSTAINASSSDLVRLAIVLKERIANFKN